MVVRSDMFLARLIDIYLALLPDRVRASWQVLGGCALQYLARLIVYARLASCALRLLTWLANLLCTLFSAPLAGLLILICAHSSTVTACVLLFSSIDVSSFQIQAYVFSDRLIGQSM